VCMRRPHVHDTRILTWKLHACLHLLARVATGLRQLDYPCVLVPELPSSCNFFFFSACILLVLAITTRSCWPCKQCVSQEVGWPSASTCNMPLPTAARWEASMLLLPCPMDQSTLLFRRICSIDVSSSTSLNLREF
jgi:hypothetical protein